MKSRIMIVVALMALQLGFGLAKAEERSVRDDINTPSEKVAPTVTLTEKELSDLIQAEIAKAVIQRETQPIYDKLNSAFGKKP